MRAIDEGSTEIWLLNCAFERGCAVVSSRMSPLLKLLLVLQHELPHELLVEIDRGRFALGMRGMSMRRGDNGINRTLTWVAA